MSDRLKSEDSALHVRKGVKGGHDGLQNETFSKKFRKKNEVALNIEQFALDVLAGNRTALAKAITLIESANIHHKKQAQLLLQELLPHTGKSLRIGITGVPGAGKSTFIETFGTMLCKQGFKVAVLAIDPSSSLTGGSILGDKTRMEQLVREPNAFVRPSPSAGTLGGVHKKSRETMLLCEAAGYDIILVETVGVGQSETYVRGMVDFFMLLVLTGAGDELQGMKKGIMELADAVIVNKADGENLKLARKTMKEYQQMLHFLQPSTNGWMSDAKLVSSITKTGLEEVWDMLLKFKETTIQSGAFSERRQRQTKEWFHQLMQDRIMDAFYNQPGRKPLIESLESKILQGELTVSQGIEEVFKNDRLSQEDE